jgi:hypothetical protein
MVEPELDTDALRRDFPQLQLLLLHGSRARGDAHELSDWDFAYLADANHEFDELGLRAALVRALATDKVDLMDLGRAGGLVRYRAARDGRLIIERQPGNFERFSVAAIGFWLDAQGPIRAGYAAVLESLG